MPPAAETAAASCGVAAGPIGACITGSSHGSALLTADDRSPVAA